MLCVIIFFSITGLSFFQFGEVWISHHAGQQKINNKNVTIENTNIVELNAIDVIPFEKNEIIYQGNLYDVFKEETRGNKKILFCILDTKETNAVKKLVITFNEWANKKQSQNKISYKVPVFFNETILCFSFTCSNRIINKINFNNSIQIQNGFLKSVYIPPDFV